MNDIILEIVQIDPEIVPFIIPYTPDDIKKIENINLIINNNLELILNFFNYFLKESQNPFIITLPSKVIYHNKNKLPIINYCHLLFLKFQTKLNKIKENFYQKQANIASKLYLFVTKFNESNHKCIIDTDLYSKNVSHLFALNNEILKILKKICILESYLSKKIVQLPSPISLEILSNSLIETSINVDKSIEYSPYGLFDRLFFEFIEFNNTTQRFTLSANIIKEDQTNLKECEHLFKSFSMLLNPNNSKQKFTLYSSIIRIIYDQISIQYLENYFKISIEEIFYIKCYKLSQFTSIEFNINSNLIKFEDFTLPFNILILKYEDLLNSTKNIFGISFLNNPLDMIYEIFKSVKLIDQFVLKNLMEITQNFNQNSTMMSFDDIFSIFLAIFVQNPPINCLNISKHFITIKNLTLSSAFDFAKLLFNSTIDYINNYKL